MYGYIYTYIYILYICCYAYIHMMYICIYIYICNPAGELPFVRGICQDNKLIKPCYSVHG